MSDAPLPEFSCGNSTRLEFCCIAIEYKRAPPLGMTGDEPSWPAEPLLFSQVYRSSAIIPRSILEAYAGAE